LNMNCTQFINISETADTSFFQSLLDIRSNIRIILEKMGKTISQKHFSEKLEGVYNFDMNRNHF
jgi:hypothetical protein